KQMKITNRNAAFALGATDMNDRFERSQCHVHIRWICGDAMFTGAQNGEATVYSGDGRATRSGLPFVARHGRVAEIHAAGSLQEVTGGGRHVAKLGRSAT